MKKIIITVLATITICTAVLYAQLPNIIRDDMVINGLTLCQSYTQEQMIEALGQPDSINIFTGDVGTTHTYYYGSDYFTVIEDGNYFIDFIVTNSRFSFNNFISIGDPVARVSLLGGVTENREFTNSNGVPIKYKLWRLAKETNEDKHYSSSIKFIYNDEGYITKIEAVYYQWL